MLIFGQGTDDYILVMFQVTILGAGYNMWGNERRSALSECFSGTFFWFCPELKPERSLFLLFQGI